MEKGRSDVYRQRVTAESTGKAIAAAQQVANAHGIRASKARLIGGYSNTIIELEPLSLVARVTTCTGEVRGSSEWLRREVEVCAWLETLNALSVRPARSLPAGPHKCGELALTFWEYVQVQKAPVSPAAAGASLRVLHSALAECPVRLPPLVPIEETWRLLQRPVIRQALTAGETTLLIRTAARARSTLERYELTLRPLHGDAHHGNLWATGQGLIWGDFEDTHAGPAEWDLACLVTSSIVLGSGQAAREALEAYGEIYDGALLELLTIVRTLQAIGWAFVARPNASVSKRLRKRLEWLSSPTEHVPVT